jgi:hypothetical protein
MPHDRYSRMTQSLAADMPGVPVSRGPIESRSTWERAAIRELSIPADQMRRRTGSLLGKVSGTAGSSFDDCAGRVDGKLGVAAMMPAARMARDDFWRIGKVRETR